MINSLFRRENIEDGFSILDSDILRVLDESVLAINKAIENKDGKQKKLKLSQVKIVQASIRSLIEEGKSIFNKANTKEEKLDIIEQILTSIDYIFANTNTKKLFVRYSSFKLENFNRLGTESQIFKFIFPKDYNIKYLKSLSGGNCYMMGVSFYYKLLKEIVGDDDDIKFKFHIDANDNHGTISINDIFFIDSNISEFFKKIGKDNKKTNFYRLSVYEELSEFLKELGVFKEFDSMEDFMTGIKKLKEINTVNFVIGGKNYIRFAVSRKGKKIFLLFLKKVGGRMIYTELDESEKDIKENNNKQLDIDYMIDILINQVSKSKKDKELLSYIFKKLDRSILENIFSGVISPDELRFKTLPGFLVKFLENDKIRFFVKKVYNKLKG